MVTAEHNGARSFYMVNTDRPDRACDEINKITGLDSAQALAPLSDVSLAHHDVRPGQPWLCFTTNGPTAEIASSRFGQEMAY
jgi:hypothetical protein